MIQVVCILNKDGDLALMGATEDVEIVLVTEVERVRKLRLENIALSEMTPQDLQAAVCDHLSHELQTGRLDLVQLNNALRLE